MRLEGIFRLVLDSDPSTSLYQIVLVKSHVSNLYVVLT